MTRIPVIFFVTLLSSVHCQNILVEDTKFEGRSQQVLVEKEGNITLRCVSPRPWFFCVWEGPQGGRVCGLRDKLASDGHQALCGGDDRLNITGNATVCEVTISGVDLGDHGAWTCAISDNLSLDTNKQVVEVGVVVGGAVSLSPSVGPVQLGEGDTAQFICRVDRVWPRPEITWTLEAGGGQGDDTWPGGLLDTDTQVWVDTHDSHLVSLAQTVTYTAARRDTGANITCTVTQHVDMTRVLVQQRTVSLQVLPPTALRNSKDTALADKVGLVSLIFVSLLAVVMILVMVTMLGLKKRCGKAEMYRPVYSGGQPGGPDMYQHQPLNISYIDLYSHCNPATGDNHKLLVAANSEVGRGDTTKDNSSGLGSSSASFNESISDCGDNKSVKTYKETHFDTLPLPPPSYQLDHHEHCPANQGHGTLPLHAVHTLPYTLFHCQHSCFNQLHQNKTCNK